MRTTLYIIIALVALFSLGSCTHNNGDIGPWFGTWHVESITCDAEPVSLDADYFFQFQSTVCRVSQVGDHEQVVESFGIWDDNGEGLAISFRDSTVFYIDMPGLEVNNIFALTEASSSSAVLSKVTSSNGAKYTYRLKKQP